MWNKNNIKRIVLLVLVAIGCIALIFGCAQRGGMQKGVKTETSKGEVGYSYEVILPNSYDENEKNRRYPVVYVLPEDGIAKHNTCVDTAIREAFEEKIACEMLVVKVNFTQPSETVDVSAFEQIKAIISEVDEKYNTVAEPTARAVLGTKTGGYLASVFTYTDGEQKWQKRPKVFGLMASIHGDYQSKENIWKDIHGDFCGIAKEGASGDGQLDNDIAIKFYTYMDAASEEEDAVAEGGVNDVISYFLRRGAAYPVALGYEYYDMYGNADSNVLNLTIKNSVYDDSFVTRSVKEAMEGISSRLLKDMVTGTIRLTPQAALASEEKIDAVYSIAINEAYETYCMDLESDMEVKISMEDAESKEELSKPVCIQLKVNKTKNGELYENVNTPISLPNIVKGENSSIKLSATILGKEILLDTKPLVRITATGTKSEEQLVDLLGSWKFKAMKNYGQDKLETGMLPQKEAYDTWEEVYPCMDWWAADFSRETNMNEYAGYGWYVKEFTVPSDFPEGEYYVPMGYFDETDICFLNGKMIGSTGLHPETWKHEEDCWDTERVYTVDSSVLHIGGENVIMVLTHNQSGAGGWYDGHPGIYTAEAYEALRKASGNRADSERFFAEVIPSKHRAKALHTGEEYADEEFLVYLPEGYFEPENANRRYPTAYLFHQLNSSSNSYVLDGIDKLLDEGIADGKIKDMIVIIPDSTKDSWWQNGWDTMVTEEILPYVDGKYRTIPDARYRFTAGASMGGHGAYYIALKNPKLFSGVISFFGAINMEKNPLAIMQRQSGEYLGYFKHYFVCGNRDLYKFGIPAIALDKKLRSYGIEHFFELEEGEHDSEFYLPYVIDAFSYQTENMPTITSKEAVSLIQGKVKSSIVKNGNLQVEAELKIADIISEYLLEIPASEYTKEYIEQIHIPVTCEVKNGDEILCSETKILAVSKGMTENLEWKLQNEKILKNESYEVTVTAGILNETVKIQ